jgi:acyl transferase domain-containing protein
MARTASAGLPVFVLSARSEHQLREQASALQESTYQRNAGARLLRGMISAPSPGAAQGDL